MKINIFHLVIKLCVLMVLEAASIAPTGVENNDEKSINSYFENKIAIIDTTLSLRCPNKSNKMKLKLLYNASSTEGTTLELNSDTLMELRPTGPQDSGFYGCFTNDSDIVKIFNVTLTEFELPRFTRNPKKYILRPVGNSLRLQCKARGTPTPNITWYKNNKSPPKRMLGEIRFKNWSLTLKAINLDDRGNYTCVVCNIVGCINFTSFVDVYHSCHSIPFIKDGYPRNATKLLNSTVEFQCPQLIADMEPFIQWVRIENPRAADDYAKLNATNLQNSGNISEVYQITNTTHEDEGWYACLASNGVGSSWSAAYLKVVDKEGEEPRS